MALSNILWLVSAAVVATTASIVGRTFNTDLAAAQARVQRESVVVQTQCGPIEYAESGSGRPLLVIHGAGGGFDHATSLAEPLVARGFRVIAPSRFGYLRTPLPGDASPAAQADAHACLLDALNVERAAVIAVTAGAPSALQLAIRHPQRVSSLVLHAPVAWRPGIATRPVVADAPWRAWLRERLVQSDFLYWTGLHVAYETVVRLLPTPPEALAGTTAMKDPHVRHALEDVLPISARSAGLRNDARVASALSRYELEAIRAPTLVIAPADGSPDMLVAARYTASRVPGARLVCVPDADLRVTADDPRALDALASFVGTGA